MKTAHQQGILKTLCYSEPQGVIETSSVNNAVPYQPRRVNDRGEARVTLVKEKKCAQEIKRRGRSGGQINYV